MILPFDVQVQRLPEPSWPTITNIIMILALEIHGNRKRIASKSWTTGRPRTSEEKVEVERCPMTDSNTQVNLLEQHLLTT